MQTESAPGTEPRMIDGVCVEIQFSGQNGWCISPHQTKKHRALPGSEVRIHRVQNHPGKVPCLGLDVGGRMCRGQFLPELRRETCARAVPSHVLSQLGHHFEDDEPGGPGREPALTTKVSDLSKDEEQGVRCGLAGQIVEVRSGNAKVKTSLARLTPRGAKQEFMEFLAGSFVR